MYILVRTKWKFTPVLSNIEWRFCEADDLNETVVPSKLITS